MDYRLFVESLDLRELNTLSNLIWERRKRIAQLTMEPVIESEIALVKEGKWIEAIKEYRDRTDCDLLTAKTAIDSVRSCD